MPRSPPGFLRLNMAFKKPTDDSKIDETFSSFTSSWEMKKEDVGFDITIKNNNNYSSSKTSSPKK